MFDTYLKIIKNKIPKNVKTRIRLYHKIIKNKIPKLLRDELISLAATHKKIKNYKEYLNVTKDSNCLEIGGPSTIFLTKVPIYSKVKNVDNINFNNSTVWTGEISNGRSYNYYANKYGYQFFNDGTNLSKLDNSSYDCVLSSHCLEHIANPLKALFEWKRVLKENCYLILALPNKVHSFDHKRPYTTFDHILEDYKNDIGEDDMTHYKEIIDLHDISKDPPAINFENFKERSKQNFNNRCFHHHVFSKELILKILNYSGFELIDFNCDNYEFVTLSKKHAKTLNYEKN